MQAVKRGVTPVVGLTVVLAVKVAKVAPPTVQVVKAHVKVVVVLNVPVVVQADAKQVVIQVVKARVQLTVQVV